MRIKLDTRGPDQSTPRWFNIGAPMIRIDGPTQRGIHVWLWSCFNRRCADGDHYWGVGLLNINGRHLFYVGHENIDILFVRVWPGGPR